MAGKRTSPKIINNLGSGALRFASPLIEHAEIVRAHFLSEYINTLAFKPMVYNAICREGVVK
jgi:hypothetical protein